MDIEGAEGMVLNGARRALERYRPIVFFALHGAEQMLGVQALMKATGYRPYGLDGAPLAGRLETDEVYALPRQSEQGADPGSR